MVLLRTFSHYELPKLQFQSLVDSSLSRYLTRSNSFRSITTLDTFVEERVSSDEDGSEDDESTYYHGGGDMVVRRDMELGAAILRQSQSIPSLRDPSLVCRSQ